MYYLVLKLDKFLNVISINWKEKDTEETTTIDKMGNTGNESAFDEEFEYRYELFNFKTRHSKELARPRI